MLAVVPATSASAATPPPVQPVPAAQPSIYICNGNVCATPQYFQAQAVAPTNGDQFNISGPVNVAEGAALGCALGIVAGAVYTAFAPEVAGVTELIDAGGSQWQASCIKGAISGGLAVAVRGVIRWVKSVNPFVVSPQGAGSSSLVVRPVP